MSRLDWFTILIVGICITALGFLVYKTIKLIGNEKSAQPKTEIAKTENAANSPETYDQAGNAKSDQEAAPGSEDEDLDDDELPYNPEEVQAPAEKTTAAKEPETTTPKPAVTTSQKTPAPSATQAKPAPGTTSTSTTTPKGGTPTSYESNSNGDFMVVAGSFSQKYNAESQVKYLKGLGYKNASVEIFNNGSLATALVDRFSNYEAATKLVGELKGKGVDAFIKKKQ